MSHSNAWTVRRSWPCTIRECRQFDSQRLQSSVVHAPLPCCAQLDSSDVRSCFCGRSFPCLVWSYVLCLFRPPCPGNGVMPTWTSQSRVVCSLLLPVVSPFPPGFRCFPLVLLSASPCCSCPTCYSGNVHRPLWLLALVVLLQLPLGSRSALLLLGLLHVSLVLVFLCLVPLGSSSLHLWHHDEELDCSMANRRG